MARKNHLFCTAVIFFFSLFQTSALANKKSYIVYLGAHAHGKEATWKDYHIATASHYHLLGHYLGSAQKAREAIFYSYTKHINGFAAMLEEGEAMQLSKHPGVVSLFENKPMKLHTTRSWEVLGLQKSGQVPSSSIWVKSGFGKDVVIANLDTGVWPESQSFDDKGMGPIPSNWKGSCDNNTKAGVVCNKKLIGARHFSLGYQAAIGHNYSPPGNSARDIDGHGTHTLSTAAGNRVPNASIFGYASGTASGGSPGARVAAYKVCWEGCYGADLMAGYDAAIHDGVDVISVSLGGNAADFITDPIAIGSFHAVAAGISVIASAGNSGPHEGTTSNLAPWVTTVAASTLDRMFPANVVLGNKKQIQGQSLSQNKLPAEKMYPLIRAEDGQASNVSSEQAKICDTGSLDPKKVKGKIVICTRGDNMKMTKGLEVTRAGGVGMVLVNDEYSGNDVYADLQILPQTNIAFNDSRYLYAYMNSTKSPIGTISGPTTQLGIKPSPVMADFSSRGPNTITPQILKPDITAAGYNVLAAYTEATGATAYPNDTRRVKFNLLSGTSMSCPHVAGVTGLLKSLYPKWTPAAIRSAIMTTANIQDNTGSPMKDYDGQTATPLMYGSGHIDPNKAMDPGLIYDLKVNDYLNFLCALGYNASMMASFTEKPYKCPSKPVKIEDLNYPSIAVHALHGSITVTRIVTNVGNPGTYKAQVEAPEGTSVSVNPEILTFSKVSESKVYKVTMKSRKMIASSGYVFGAIVWSDGKHFVRTPLVVN